MIVSVLANKVLGLPVLYYFDDFGLLAPAMVKEIGIQGSLRFTTELGALTKGDKSQGDKYLAFLGFRADCAMLGGAIWSYVYHPRRLRRKDGPISRPILRQMGRYPIMT